MRAIIQRVLSASVSVNGATIASMGKGYLVLVGIHHQDTVSDRDYIIRKLLNIRLFDDDLHTGPDGHAKPWALSIMQCQLKILCVSQFTLYSHLKGKTCPIASIFSYEHLLMCLHYYYR